MQWTDIHEIVDGLIEAQPSTSPLTVRFTDLRDYVLALPGFEGSKDGCNERILEAIQMLWIDELD